MPRLDLILFSIPCFKCLLFSLFIIKKAQVEAKKEHEGAVQLLEVSAGAPPTGCWGSEVSAAFAPHASGQHS